MDKPTKIKVLVVDDSLLFRETIARAVSSDPQIVISAVAANPFEARDKIVETHPDVVVCDVEMPLMNGIEFLRRLLPQCFVPVVMVSSGGNQVSEAIEAGAVDFVAKPDMHSNKSVEDFCHDLIRKIKAASAVKAALPKQERTISRLASNVTHGAGTIIAMGASTGGTEAIFNILRVLPPTIPGIVIVQHIPPIFSKMFADRLESQTALRVKEAETGDYADQGTALIAPGDRHMRIRKIGERYRAECFCGEKVNGHCPSVDVLFDSVAKEAGNCAVGILLTGMGYDGAKGLLNIRRKGGQTIGQDKNSSVVYGMPKVAFDIGAVNIQAALEDIPKKLFGLLR